MKMQRYEKKLIPKSLFPKKYLSQNQVGEAFYSTILI